MNYLLVIITCTVSLVKFQGVISEIRDEDVLESIKNTLDNWSESIVLLLEIVESIDFDKLSILSNDSEREATYNFAYNLLASKLSVRELNNFLKSVCDRVAPLIDWDWMVFDQYFSKEWIHLENYTKTLKNRIERIHSLGVYAEGGCYVETCTQMPVGPPAHFVISESGRSRPFTKTVDQNNHFEELHKYVNESLGATVTIYSKISETLLLLPTVELSDEEEIKKTVNDLLDRFLVFIEDAIDNARSTPNLFVDKFAVNNSRLLTIQALTIRDTMLRMELH